MKAIITTLELGRTPGIAAITLTPTGDVDEAEVRHLYELFTSSAVVEVDVRAAIQPAAGLSTSS